MSNQNSKRRERLLLFVISVLVIGTLLIISSVKKNVAIEGSLTCMSFSFVVQNDVRNLLNLEFLDTVQEVTVSSFSELSVSKLISHRTLKDSFLSNDITSKVSIKSSFFNNLIVNKGCQVDAIIVKESDHFYLKLFLSNFNKRINLVAKENTEIILKNLFRVQSGSQVIEEPFYSDQRIRYPNMVEIDFVPLKEKIAFTVQIPNGKHLDENKVQVFNSLQFDKEYFENEWNKSSITEGVIKIKETNQSYVLGKNEILEISKNDLMYINHFSVSQMGIKLQFKGLTTRVEIGLPLKNVAPSLLEYLKMNQSTILILNSYLIIITLLISIIKN